MPSPCFWCHIKKLEDCIYITKFLEVKCEHFGDKVHLDYYFSLKYTLVQIIYLLVFITTTYQSIVKLTSNPDTNPSNYWSQIAFIFLPIFIVITCTSTLITNKNRFDLYCIITDFLTFAKEAKLELLKESDLKMPYNYMKYMKIILFINPIYILCLYSLCLGSGNILLELSVILAAYFILCNSFLAISIILFSNVIANNIKNELKKLLLKRKREFYNNETFKVNFKIIQMMVSKSTYMYKQAEIALRLVIAISYVLLPIGLEIVLINIQLTLFTNNIQDNKYILTEFNIIICGLLTCFLFAIFSLQLRYIQRIVSEI